jgi:hypothetical protein
MYSNGERVSKKIATKCKKVLTQGVDLCRSETERCRFFELLLFSRHALKLRVRHPFGANEVIELLRG